MASKTIHTIVLEWAEQSKGLFTVIAGISLFLFVAFADKVPATWRWQLSTLIGRTLLLVLLYLVFIIGGWIPSLLFGIGIGLLWANRPLAKPVSRSTSESSLGPEGFQDMKEIPVQGDKWFVEKVLEENPRMIVQDRKLTKAIQDDSQTGNSRTSQI